MDKEHIRYIINYFSKFLSENESKAHRHLMSLEKLNGKNENSNIFLMYKKKDWISSDPRVLELVKNGPEQFYSRTAERIYNDNIQEVFFNNCPNCEKLTRTPEARQCRHCGYQWFE